MQWCLYLYRAVRMAHVLWPTNDNFVPPSLTRVPFNKITLELDTSTHYIQVCQIYCVSKTKTLDFWSWRPSANSDQFSKMFHWQISKETVYISVIEASVWPQLHSYSTLWNSKIQNNCQTFTPTIRINLFYMKRNKT